MFNKFSIDFNFDGRQYSGEVKPLLAGAQGRMPTRFQVFLNHMFCGTISRKGMDWETDSPKCAFMLNTIANTILDRYE